MKQRIQVTVLIPHPCKCGEFKELFNNIIETDDSFSYDYQGIVNGLKLLFPNNQLIINLKIS